MWVRSSDWMMSIILASDGKFPELFTSEKFPETFPTRFAHRFLLVDFFYRIIYMFGFVPHFPQQSYAPD
jgi:hypothetical protein